MDVKITTKNGTEIAIEGIENFKTFRDFANQITTYTGFVIFEQAMIAVSEISTIELIRQEKT